MSLKPKGKEVIREVVFISTRKVLKGCVRPSLADKKGDYLRQNKK